MRYRATATLRRLQIKQYTASNEGGGYKTNSPAGTLNKCSNFEESMKLCKNVEYDHLNYFSYSAIRNSIRHAIYFKLKNVILKTLIRMTL